MKLFVLNDKKNKNEVIKKVDIKQIFTEEYKKQIYIYGYK
jgi:hypothetical protein